MREYFFGLILFFPILLVHLTLLPLVSINNTLPDLILILLVYYTLKNGQLYGTILGFIYGLLFDVITGGILGATMLTKTLAGFVAGYFYNENKKDIYFKSYSFLLIVFLSSIIDSVAFTFISSFDLTSNIISLLINLAILPAIYTTTLSTLISVFYPKRRYI
jgi:rod shape-determining protein MreD